MKSLKTAVAHARSTCNESAANPRAHAMKTRTRNPYPPLSQPPLKTLRG